MLSHRTTGPYRSTICQFKVPSGKYVVFPITDTEITGFYKMRMYFNCEKDVIQFHSETQRKEILSYGVSRSNLFTSSIKSNPLTTIIMTPYALDEYLNDQSSKSLISIQKRVFEASGKFYEDNAPGSLSTKMKLISDEVA